MGEGNWSLQLEEKYGQLENPTKEEFHKDFSQVFDLANLAENVAVQGG